MRRGVVRQDQHRRPAVLEKSRDTLYRKSGRHAVEVVKVLLDCAMLSSGRFGSNSGAQASLPELYM